MSRCDSVKYHRKGFLHVDARVWERTKISRVKRCVQSTNKFFSLTAIYSALPKVMVVG